MLTALGYALAGAGAVILFFACLVEPEVGGLLFVALIPFSVSEINHELFLPTLLMISMTGGLLVRGAASGRLTARESLGVIWSCIFVGYFLVRIVGWLESEATLGGFNLLAFYVALPMFLTVYPNCLPAERPIPKLLKAFMVGSLFYYAILILLYFAAHRLVTTDSNVGYDRLLGLGGTHPAYAMSSIPLALAAALYFIGEGSHRLLAVLTIVATLMVTVLTASRAAAISVALVLLICPLVLGGKSLRRTLVGVAILSTAGLTAYFMFGHGLEKMLIEFSLRLGKLGKKREVLEELRWFSALAGIELFRQQPVLGIGVGQFSRLATPAMLGFAKRIRGGIGLVGILHSRYHGHSELESLFLYFLVETGVVGLLLFGGVLGFALKGLLNFRKYLPAHDQKAVAIIAVSWLILLLHVNFVSGAETLLVQWLVVSLGLGAQAQVALFPTERADIA